MTSIQLKDLIINALEDKKAEDIVALNVAERTILADFFIICSGKSTTQVKALAENVEEKLEAEGIFATRKEGLREGRWAVLDYGSVIVHVFNSDTRDFYALEKLWK